MPTPSGVACGPAALLRTLSLAALLIAAVSAQAARTSTALDGPWRFTRADVASAAEPTLDDATWDRVTLPHTWNGTDGEAGGGFYRGPGWYRRAIERP